MNRSIPVALLLASLLTAEPVYLVVLKGANSLGFLTPAGKAIATVPVGQHPHEMVFSPDRKLVYITDNGMMRMEHQGNGGNTVSIVDVKAKRKIGVITLGEFRRPHGIDIDSTGQRLVVTTELPSRLLVIDTGRRSVIRNFDVQGEQPHMVTLRRDGKVAFVSVTGASHVSAIDLSSGRLIKIPTEARPQGSVLSRDGRELYVTNSGASSITVISTETNKAIAHIPTGRGPNRIALTPDGGRLVYSLSAENKVAFGDPETRTELGYVLLPYRPASCTVSADGSLAFASAEAQDTVYLVSVQDRKIKGEIRTPKGSGPDPVLELR
jgi:YVTN family beta-propeller protein